MLPEKRDLLFNKLIKKIPLVGFEMIAAHNDNRRLICIVRQQQVTVTSYFFACEVRR